MVYWFGGQRYTLGMIFREVADAIELQAGTRIAEPGEPAAGKSTTATAAEAGAIDAANGRGAEDDDH